MRGVLAATAAAVLMVAPAATSAESEATAAGPICGGHASAAAPGPAKPAQSLLEGYGSGGFRIQTSNPKAQAYFDNGMQLGHAFAHKASIAAFQEARRLDPACGMCAWGEAWSRGPTINYPIDGKEQAELAKIADRAAQLAADGPDKERRLTAALQLRYRHGGGKGSGDIAFAKAMESLAHQHPDDNELAILAADAWMIPASHNNNSDNLDKALTLLGAALVRNPNDTGAIHFYIHATEYDGVPERALPYATRLQALAPAASHLVHMPSHTYYWVGRYDAAVRSNVDAVAIDEANARRLSTKDGAWGLAYHGHNVSFGIGAAMMDGDGASALPLARSVIARVGLIKPGDGGSQTGTGRAYYAFGRYGAPDEVAALKDPGAGLPYLRVMWRYARGEAAARRGDLAALKAETAAMASTPVSYGIFNDDARRAQALVEIARLVLVGRTALLEHRPKDAVRAFQVAAEHQEKVLFDRNDPPAWWYPVRRSLAAAELAGGDSAEAAHQAKAVLAHTPDDPLTLWVLAGAERALGQTAEAGQALAKARSLWYGQLPDEISAV